MGMKNFYKTEKYKLLFSQLDSSKQTLLIQIVGEAIQYGIAVLSKNLEIANKKEAKTQ